MVAKPLAGIRVADFSWVAAGPIATEFLAVLGAEVIKIESAARSDLAGGGPLSPMYYACNYSKLSCSLNITKPEGLALAKEIIKKSDVVIDNFAAGTMDRRGLGYEALREIKPDIIVVSAGGLGRTGPYKDHVIFGNLAEAYSGLDSVTGYEGGPPGEPGSPWSDPLNGCYIAFAMLAALKHRRTTGEGQYIDISMSQVCSVQLPEPILEYTIYGTVPGPTANIEEGAAPHNCYPCLGEDKWVAIAVTNEAQWAGLCRAVGNPSWCREERFADGHRRFQHRQELDRLVGEWTRQHTAQQVMEILQAEGVPAGPSHNAKESLEDPHLRATGYYVPIEVPEAGPALLAGLPWRLHPNPAGYSYGKAPQLGEHNSYVFGDLLGISEDEITALAQQGVIY